MTDALLRASLGGGIAAFLIWLTLRTFRLSPKLQTALWWAVSLKFLVMLVWAPPLEIGILPGIGSASHSERGGGAPALGPATGTIDPESVPATRGAVPDAPSRGVRVSDWRSVVLGLWLVGVFASIVHGYCQGRRTSAIWRSARPAPASINNTAHDLALTLGVASPPPILISDRTPTPLVMGLWRHAIVLPESFALGGAMASLRLALAHELIHVRRRDLQLAWAPALAGHLFFFHPLARLAAREYALSREAACDAAVVDELGVAPHDYGTLLLDLGIGRPGSALVAAGAPWSAAHLRRRLIMLEFPWIRSRRSQLLAGIALALGALALIPAHLVARRSPPRTTVVMPAAPTAVDQTLVAPEGGFTFVLFLGPNRTISNGGTPDMARARRSRQSDESLLWFRLGTREYVVRDPSALAALTRAWDAQGREELELSVRDTADEAVAQEQRERLDFHARIQEEHAKLRADEEAHHVEELMKSARRHVELQALDDTAKQRQLERQTAGSSATEREQELRAGLAELRSRMVELEVELAQLQNRPLEATTSFAREQALLERELQIRAKEMHTKQEATERALAETRRLLEEIVAAGQAQRVP